MSISDKNIIITPNTSGVKNVDPKIVFTGADSSVGDSAAITLKATSVNSGTLSFTGSRGNLFSISNTFTGTLFSVNDVSGIPSLEIKDNGIIKIAETNGKTLISTSDSGNSDSDVLNVGGNIVLGEGAYFTSRNPFVAGRLSGGGVDQVINTSANTYSTIEMQVIPPYDSSNPIRDLNGDFVFHQKGFYLINFNMTTEHTTNSTSRAEIQMRLRKNSSEISGCDAFTYNRTKRTDEGEETASICRIIQIDSGDTLHLQAKCSVASMIMDGDGCRFSAFKL